MLLREKMNVMKSKLWILIFATAISCHRETPDPVLRDISGRYSGTIAGSFYPSDFPISKQESFTESASFEIVVQESDGSIIGFDSLSASLTVDRNNSSQFAVMDISHGGDLRINATGRCKNDTMEMTGSYHFPDRSKRSFRFIGVKM